MMPTQIYPQTFSGRPRTVSPSIGVKLSPANAYTFIAFSVAYWYWPIVSIILSTSQSGSLFMPKGSGTTKNSATMTASAPTKVNTAFPLFLDTTIFLTNTKSNTGAIMIACGFSKNASINTTADKNSLFLYSRNSVSTINTVTMMSTCPQSAEFAITAGLSNISALRKSPALLLIAFSATLYTKYANRISSSSAGSLTSTPYSADIESIPAPSLMRPRNERR